jgi:hypothetical protein
MTVTGSSIQRRTGVIGLLLSAPLLLAWLAVQSLKLLGTGQQWEMQATPGQSLPRVLLLGPLLETVLMMTAAVVVAQVLARRQPGTGDHLATSAGLIGLSFVASHLLSKGAAALVSAPMAFLLSACAVYAVQQPNKVTLVMRGFVLFVMHSLYNASLLALGDH